MAGTFAHITLVDSLCQNADALDSLAGGRQVGVDHMWYRVKLSMPADFTMDPAQRDKH